MIQYMLDLLHFTHCNNFPHGSNSHELVSKPHQAVSRLDNPSFCNFIVRALNYLKLNQLAILLTLKFMFIEYSP